MIHLLFMVFIASLAFVLILLSKRVLKPFASELNSRTAIIVFFFGLIFVCFIWGFFSKQKISHAENRNLEKWKPLKETRIIDIPGQIDTYVNDHFGLREKFINLYRYFQFNVFGQSISERVVKGRNSWLFNYHVIKLCHINKPLSKNEVMETRIIDQLKKMEVYLNKRSIKLVIIIMPAKPYIYPEYLPRWVNFNNNNRKTINNFKELVNAETNIPLLDLYNPLLQAKQTEVNNLFYKNDTHWNSVGAFYGWKNTLKFFSDEGISYKPIDFNDHEIKIYSHNGDLSGMLGVTLTDNSNGYFIKSDNVKNRVFLSKSASEVLYNKKDNINWQKLSVSFKNENESKTDIPLIFGDSFFLASAFSWSIPFDKYYSAHYNETNNCLPFIMRNHNDQNIVILSFVDREFTAFVNGLAQWDPDKQIDYNGYGWEQKLPY